MANEMRVLIVGSGQKFQCCVETLHERENRGEIKIVAITDENVYASRAFYWPFWRLEDLVGIPIHCVVVAVDGDAKPTLSKLYKFGIGDDYIIPWQALFLPGFSFQRYLKLKKSHISIIANMCWGGVTYHYFYLPFYSPFINMFLWRNEYLEMLKNLKETLASPLKYERDDFEQNMKREFPVFSTGGGTIVHEPLY